MRKLRQGDEVIVIAGKDKSRRGRILKVIGDRVIVEGLNMVKRHTKANPMRNVPGGIIEREAALHVSNVQLYNPESKKGDRIGIRVLEDGRKVRYFKSSGEVVDV